MGGVDLKTIDQDYYLPDELVGYEYSDKEDTIEEDDGDGLSLDDVDSLSPPSNITIVSQTVRKVKGQEFVDVVIEVLDVKDGLTYDKKIAKEKVADTDPNALTVVDGTQI